MSVALVTGATSGLGEGFARRLAGDGHDLVLVARGESRLADLAAELRAQGVRAEVIVADLSDREDLDRVAARFTHPQRPVDVLVNSAGFGLNQPFVGGALSTEQAAIDVMVTAVMRLTHAALPGMQQRGHGLVVNISSIASFLPLGSYSAAKSWVTAFSRGLASELSGTGVQAIAVCPGLVRTQFHDRAGMDVTRSKAWMWLSVDEVVDQAFGDISRGQSVSVAGMQYRTVAAATHWLPRSVVTWLAGHRGHVVRRS